MPQSNLKSLRRDFVNPYAVMLPYFGRYQEMVYRQGEVLPGLEGYQPRWQIVSAVLGAQQSLQQTIDLMTGFHLLAILGSASVNTVGGFRAFLFDVLRQLRLQDRGIQFPQLGGAAKSPFFLREPYPFDLPASQVKVLLTNMEAQSNTVQLVLYGVVAPFTGRLRQD